MAISTPWLGMLMDGCSFSSHSILDAAICPDCILGNEWNNSLNNQPVYSIALIALEEKEIISVYSQLGLPILPNVSLYSVNMVN